MTDALAPEMTPEERLAAIRQRLENATPGPWGWFGDMKFHNVYLATQKMGRRFVMQFGRWGMKGGQPIFQHDAIMRTMAELRTLGLVVAKEYGAREIIDVIHPDAVLIANAPTDLRFLLDRVSALEAERAAFGKDYGMLLGESNAFEIDRNYWRGRVATLEAELSRSRSPSEMPETERDAELLDRTYRLTANGLPLEMTGRGLLNNFALNRATPAPSLSSQTGSAEQERDAERYWALKYPPSPQRERWQRAVDDAAKGFRYDEDDMSELAAAMRAPHPIPYGNMDTAATTDSADGNDPLHVPSKERVAALAGMEEELAELSRRDPPLSRGLLGTVRARIAEVRRQHHRHRCLRCDQEFECQSPTECSANYDVMPVIVTRGANGQPQLADHCAQDADGKWQPVAALRSSGAETPKAKPDNDLRTARESLHRIFIFLDDIANDRPSDNGPQLEAANVLAEYEIVKDRIERLAGRDAAN